MYEDVCLNEFGFYTLKTKPSADHLEDYYKRSYHKKSLSDYSKEDLRLTNIKLEQKLLLINQHFGSDKASFLDIGSGAGFVLDFFDKKGFEVLGLDYCEDAVGRVNPQVRDKLVVGDIYKSIERLLDKGACFDIINMDCVLEHVLEPYELLVKLGLLINKNGVMIIKVPNDFSATQRYFYEKNILETPRWVAYPDHISYFDKEGLTAVCKAAGFDCVDILGDSLIELSALNPSTNYFRNMSVGKSCYLAHVAQEDLFHLASPGKTLELYRNLGEMGLGRLIIGVFKPDINRKEGYNELSTVCN